MNKDDALLFADETVIERQEDREPWKIVIADDEEEVHAVTRMVLDNFTFEGRGLELFSAYSGSDTKKLLHQHPDTAVLLLDVVMEEDTTGLEVVKYIREELENRFVRIILRTGQPGQAPERQVTMEYDINDYKEKTELTAQKLFTTIIGLLRAYRDLRKIEKSRKGLNQIAAISSSLFEQQSLTSFMHGLLDHLSLLLHIEQDGHSSENIRLAVSSQQNMGYVLIAATEPYCESEGKPISEAIPSEICHILMQAAAQQQSLYFPKTYVGYFKTKRDSEHLIYIQSQYELNDIDQELLKVLQTTIAVAFENIELTQAVIETQKEVIFTLGEIIEIRSQKTKEHTKKIAMYSHLLTLKAGLGDEAAKMIKLASSLHDVGKLGIPDAILHKPQPLTDQELEIFQQHPIIGYKILKDSKQPVLQVAAQLALQHHERWDGQGYPQGLCGEEIHILARITSIADTFDEVCGKGFREKANILSFFREQRGKRFDPALVDVFITHIDEFHAIQETQELHEC